MGSITIALAGCGNDDTGSAGAAATTAADGAGSSGSTTGTTSGGGSSGTTSSSGSGSGGTSSGTTSGSGSTSGGTSSGTTSSSGSSSGGTSSGTTSSSGSGSGGTSSGTASSSGSSSGGTSSGTTSSSGSSSGGGTNTGTSGSSGSSTGGTSTGTTGGSGGTTTSAAKPANSDNFPRLGLISISGPQAYASSFRTFAAKFQMVIIGGSWEGWEKGIGYSKQSVIDGIKSQSNVNTRVFQYVAVNSLINTSNSSSQGFPTLYNQVNALKWWLYPSMTAGTPVSDPQSSQRWLLDMGPNVPVDPSTGLGPYEWAAKYVDDLFHLGRYSGTSAAPSLDGFFLDNVLIDPSCGYGNVGNGDWSRTGTSQAHNAASTYAAVISGQKSFYTYLASAWPGSEQLGNAGTTFGIAVAGYYSGTDATLNSQILAGNSSFSGVMAGGDLEHVIGKTYSIEYYGGAQVMQQWYQTAINNYGGSKLMIFSQGSVQANGGDPLTFNSSQQAATYSPAWQGARYGITAALMNNGYYFADVGTYDEETPTNRLWFDEYDNGGAGVGYLGQPVAGAAGNPQTVAWSNGVWMREFQNGVVLWNPKGNGAKTINVATLVSPSGHTGLKHIAGKQDPAVNNGLAATSVSLQDRDGVILLWTTP